MHEMPAVPGVTATEAVALVEDGALLIDVREHDEWDDERIQGAEFRPMSLINDWYSDLPRNRKIVVHCHSGGRSAQVVHALTTQAGFADVVNLDGGIIGWKFAGHPVVTETD